MPHPELAAEQAYVDNAYAQLEKMRETLGGAQDRMATEFAAVANVSRETLSRFKSYISILEDWNARHNLVSAGSLKDVWRRHVWDSAQLMEFVPATAASLVDLGSGAGFPGLALALLLLFGELLDQGFLEEVH